jgi:RHS repeat-associated protein
MTRDDNRGIDTVEYNVLNLPKRVAGGGQEIQYVYDATGAKLAKTGSGGTQYYAGAMVYDETDLSYLLHDEGMVRIGHSGEARSYTYFYHLKDHLGNTRVEFQANSDNSYQVTQRQSYYPFGLRFEVAPAGENEYLYNGKQIQQDLIAGRSLGWYDYGARFYDAALGRWHVVDPLAEMCQNLTPYNYSINNPVRFIDPDGMVVTEGGGTDPTKLYGKQIDMSSAPGSATNAAGYPRNGVWFWKQMLAKHPEMFDGANIARIKANRAPHINETWIKHNPSHAGYEGRLVHHHIKQGKMATGIPEQAHRSMSKQLHRFVGKVKGFGRGTLNMAFIGLAALDLFSDNPHSIGSMIEAKKEGKLYYDHDSQNYFEITSKTINKDDDGNEVSADITMDVYSDYTYDKDKRKYVGTGEKTTVTTTVYKGEDAKKMYLNMKNNGMI